MARIFASAASGCRAGALAAVLALGVAVSAAPEARAAESGWYMGLNVPVMFIDDTDSTTKGSQASDPAAPTVRTPYTAKATSEYKAGFKIAGVVGYELGEGMRVEGELFFARAKVDEVTYKGVRAAGNSLPIEVEVPTSGAAKQFGGFASVWYDFRTGSDWIPYIGGGVGFIRVDQGDLEYDANTLAEAIATAGARAAVALQGGDPATVPPVQYPPGFVPDISTSDSTFAYHLGVGVGYRLNENTTLQIGYRLQTASGFEFSGKNDFGNINVDTDLRAHLVEIGFRTRF